MRRAVNSDDRGGGLVVALVVLAAMSMAVLALVSNVSSGLLAAGNLAFRQAAVLAADSGSEAAIEWLSPKAGSADLFQDQPNAGYYASLPSDLDLTGNRGATAGARIDWDDDNCADLSGPRCLKAASPLAADSAGNVVRYVIHRLCRSTGSPQAAANSCLLHRLPAGGGSNRGQLSYGASTRFEPADAVVYRITIRVRGPRDTTAFVQTLVHY